MAQAPVVGSKETSATPDQPGSYAKVYYTKHIDAEHLIKLYQKVNEGIYGKTAIKVHTGEQHGPYILPRDMVKTSRPRFLTAASSKRTPSTPATAIRRKNIVGL